MSVRHALRPLVFILLLSPGMAVADEPLPAGAVARLGTAGATYAGDHPPVAISPDGKTIASGANDRTLRLWDAATGKERHCCRGYKELRRWGG
jgi:hypothetical protein